MGDNFGIHRGPFHNSAATPANAAGTAAANLNASAASAAAAANASASAGAAAAASGSNSGLAGDDPRTQGQILSDFLAQLEDYTPTVPDAVTSHYLNSAGFEASDPRIVRLISIAAQKFISDVANDALQHCKTRTSNAPSSSHGSKANPKANKDRKYTLTMEDLAPALGDYGITVRKAHYFV